MRFFSIVKCILPLIVLFLTACNLTAVQPNYTDQIENDRQQVSTWLQLEAAQKISYLNQLILSEQLDALLIEAFDANPGLQQTLLTLKIRRAQQRQTYANKLPSIEGGYSATKEEDSSSSYVGSLSVSWEVDLWQKLDNSENAAAKDVEEQAALLQSAKDTLGAEVMKLWLSLISRKNAIKIEQQRLNTLENNEHFILQRYRSGLGSLEDLDNARSSAASSRATIEEYKEILRQQQRSLNTLLGRTQQSQLNIESSYPEVIVPLTDLPEQTLARRPDLKAAYLSIQAKKLRTKVAYKDMLPSINLGATLTDMANSPTSALLTGPIWSLLAQLTAPIYNAGKLKAKAEVAELETAYQYEKYRETLLTAVEEVENALGQEQSLAHQQIYIELALVSAKNNLTQFQRSYRTGLVDILDLLNIQQQTYNLEEQLDNIIFTRLSNRIDLGLALGLAINLELDE